MKFLRLFPLVALVSLLLVGVSEAAQKAKPLTGAFNPEEVLTNLEQKIKDRDWKAYGDFLADDFRFIPFDSVPLEQPPVIWSEWGRTAEIAFIRDLVSPNHGATLKLLDKVLERGSESRDRSEWDLVYTFNYGGQEFRSRAVFVFERVDNLWFLREWIDTTIETETDGENAVSTSGTLRAALSR